MISESWLFFLQFSNHSVDIPNLKIGFHAHIHYLMMNESRENIDLKWIEEMGEKIINCKEKCEGVKCEKDDGDYPRAFFIEAENSSRVKVMVVGENPGKAIRLNLSYIWSFHSNILPLEEDLPAG